MTSPASTDLPGTMPTVSPIREVWSIAWPTVMTMTSYTVMQFIDKLMVGQVDPLAVAAQGNGGIWSFMPLAIALGVLTVVNTFVSQNLGAGTPENGPRYAWGAFWMSLVIWICVLIPLAMVIPYVFNVMHDPAVVPRYKELIAMESGYARILLVAGVVVLISRSMHHFFFGMHRPKIITVAAILGNITNVVANYVLIFGEDGVTFTVGGQVVDLPGLPGVPALGLFGAAYGTVLGSLVELVIPLAVFLGPKLNAELNTRAQWRPSWGPIRDLLRVGWPAAIQYGNEIICWAIFMTVLVGTFGENHMSAGWIALGYMHLSFMPAVGFSVAVTSIVGKYIGAGQPDIAVARARLGLGMAVAYMTFCAVLFYVFRYPFTAAFIAPDVDPEQASEILRIGARLLICAAVFQTVDAFGIVYTGALRGAGDTVVPGLLTMIYSWTLIIGGGYAMIYFFPGLESVGPWVAASVYIIVYGISMVIRFERGRWRSIKLLTTGRASDVAPVSPGPPAMEADGAIRDIAGEIAAETASRQSSRMGAGSGPATGGVADPDNPA